ncbi:MAG: RDD family protein [Bacteroidota bacterium]
MQNIDLRTTQNVAINYELASLRERVLAFCIDMLIVLVTYVILALSIFGAFSDWLTSGMFWSVLGGLGPFAAFILYSLVSEIAANGQSWGKKALGLRVVRIDGRTPSWSDYLLRAVFYLLDGFLSLGAIGMVFITSTTKNQRLGDISANTTVIQTKNRTTISLQNLLKIDSIEAYKPSYPQVRQLQEKDMLFIKSALERIQAHPSVAHQLALSELVQHLVQLLDLSSTPDNPEDFLKTLIRDYIVLTR